MGMVYQVRDDQPLSFGKHRSVVTGQLLASAPAKDLPIATSVREF